MMKFRAALFLSGILFFTPCLYAQKAYSAIVTDFIFAYNNCEFTDAFYSEYPEAEVTKSDLRFTAFFHLSQEWHLDFTNNIGIITGLGIRNIGMITDEILPDPEINSLMINYKIIRRIYTLGIPLSFKFHCISRKNTGLILIAVREIKRYILHGLANKLLFFYPPFMEDCNFPEG